MKKIIYICSLAIGAMCLVGCEDFLDTESLTKKNTGNFPKTEVDAQQMVAGIYTVMNNNLEDPESDPFFIFDLAAAAQTVVTGQVKYKERITLRILQVIVHYGVNTGYHLLSINLSPREVTRILLCEALGIQKILTAHQTHCAKRK